MQIGHYTIQGELARGGMGVVYRAVDVRCNAEVVVKLLQVDTEAGRRRLRREAAAMLRLDHPHCVPLHDSGEHQGSPYLVLPYVVGGSLQDRLDREGTLPVAAAVSIATQVGQALQAAHALGLVHRDVKPANVLIDREQDDRVRLTDFGLVKDVGADGAATLSLSVNGRFLGTPGYWPREQAFGNLSEIGPSADVYALGALLYALLAGRPPRSTEGLIEALRAFDEPIKRLDARVPRALRNLVSRCLSDSPEARPALDDVLEGLSAWTQGASSAGGLGAKQAGALAAGATVVGLAGLVFWFANSNAQAVTHATQVRPASGPRAVSGQDAQQALLLVHHGTLLSFTGNPRGAAAEFTKAITLDPTLAKAYMNRGVCMERQNLYTEAIADYDVAIRLDPQNAKAYTNRGISKGRLGRHSDALEDYTRAIAQDPLNAEAYANLGISKRHLGRNLEALEDLNQAILLDPEHVLAHANRGISLAREGRHLEAVRDYETAIVLDSDYALASLINRGISLAKLERYLEAIDDYTRALALDPRQTKALVRRAFCRLKRGNYQAALSDTEAAIGLDPDLGLAHAYRGMSLMNLKRFKEGVAAYDRAIELDSERAMSYANRGICKGSLGQFASAIEDFNAALAHGVSAKVSQRLTLLRDRFQAQLNRR